MSSLADPKKYYQLFLSQGLGIGIGSGFLFCPSMAIQSHYFKKRRPMAMGIAISGIISDYRSRQRRILTSPDRIRNRWGCLSHNAQPTLQVYRVCPSGSSVCVPDPWDRHCCQHLHDTSDTQNETRRQSVFAGDLGGPTIYCIHLGVCSLLVDLTASRSQTLR